MHIRKIIIIIVIYCEYFIEICCFTCRKRSKSISESGQSEMLVDDDSSVDSLPDCRNDNVQNKEILSKTMTISSNDDSSSSSKSDVQNNVILQQNGHVERQQESVVIRQASKEPDFCIAR